MSASNASPRSGSDAALCSIILPTYNRAAFLPEAIGSIATQHYRRWELIVVDDGSTDDTRSRVAALAANLPGPLRYTHQPNSGAGGARARGLELAHGDYVAFLDSDDLWLPHHLSESIAALQANPQVGWIYTATSVVELDSGRVLEAHSFRPEHRPLPFLRLRTRRGAGEVRIFDDRATCRCAIEDGLYNGLSTSVLRREIFATVPMPPMRVGEDRCLSIRAVRQGVVIAYLDAVHAVRRVHTGNTSAAGIDPTAQHRRNVHEALLEAYAWLWDNDSDTFAPLECRALRRRIARERFWHLGYNLLWNAGKRHDALEQYRQALRLWPWDARMWKTFVLGWLRHHVRRQGQNPFPFKPKNGNANR